MAPSIWRRSARRGRFRLNLSAIIRRNACRDDLPSHHLLTFHDEKVVDDGKGRRKRKAPSKPKRVAHGGTTFCPALNPRVTGGPDREVRFRIAGCSGRHRRRTSPRRMLWRSRAQSGRGRDRKTDRSSHPWRAHSRDARDGNHPSRASMRPRLFGEPSLPFARGNPTTTEPLGRAIPRASGPGRLCSSGSRASRIAKAPNARAPANSDGSPRESRQFPLPIQCRSARSAGCRVPSTRTSRLSISDFRRPSHLIATPRGFGACRRRVR